MSVRLESATPEALEHIANNLRQADIEELLASSGMTPMRSIWEAQAISEYTKVFYFNDEPAGVFGLVKESKALPFGVPWMLGTDLIDKHPFAFMKLMRENLRHMLKVSPRLMNYVHSKNKKSIRFLEKLGFEIGDAEPFGVLNENFHRFYKGV